MQTDVVSLPSSHILNGSVFANQRCSVFPPCRESFAVVKGAVHLLEEGDKEDVEEETPSSLSSSAKEGDRASEARRRQLHAMVEQLRPEDTMKLVNLLCLQSGSANLETCHAERILFVCLVSSVNLFYQHV